MKTSKHLVVVSALAVLALGGRVWAEDATPAMDPQDEAAVAAAEMPAAEMPTAEMPAVEPTAEEEASALEEAPVVAAEETVVAEELSAAMPDASEDLAGEPEAELPVPLEEGAEEPVVAATVVVPPEPEVAPAPSAEEPALGMIGYDAEGRPGRIHVVVRGDTLWDVSDAYLGTPWVWPSIWQDNQDIANPHRIFPGDHIWITPSEMRKITSEEAAALLAGSPAAPETVVVAPEPAPVPEAAPAPMPVREEQPTVLISNREKVGLVTADEVEAAASIVSSVVKRVMLSQADRVWIGLGEDDVEAGDDFTVFRVQEKVYDPETGRMLGYHVHMLGWLEVLEVDAETALAEIRESSLDIAVGDRLMARRKTADEVAVQESPGDVRGQISFFAQQRTLMGTLEYVFLNRGTLDGLEVGSPLEVYRNSYKARESTRGENVRIPERVIADLLVIKAEPEVSVALIRHTNEELSLGDRFRGTH